MSQRFTDPQDAIVHDWVIGVHRSRVTGSRKPSGLKWEKNGQKPAPRTGVARAQVGVCFEEQEYVHANEWGGFGIGDQLNDNYIKLVDFYFKSAGKWSLLMRFGPSKFDHFVQNCYSFFVKFLIWVGWPWNVLPSDLGSTTRWE